MKTGGQKKTLGEVCHFTGGGTPSKAVEHYWCGDIPWVSPKDMKSDVVSDSVDHICLEAINGSATSLIPKDSVLIVVRSGILARTVPIAITGCDLTINQDLKALCPTEAIDVWFLFYLLASKMDVLLSMVSRGATVHRLITEQIRSLEFLLPPLSEQQRIVGILDEAFDGIAIAKANAEKNLQNARELFESHLHFVFTQRGEGWVCTTLEKVLTVQPQNGWSPPGDNHSDSGTPVLTLSSVTGFRFRPDKIKFTSAPTDPRRHYWVKNGDFLITRSNTPDLVGHVAIASGITEQTIYPDLIMRMNPAPDIMITEFLYYQMRSPALRREITGRAQGANPTMKKISNGAVKTLPISVPPIATQRAVVKTLTSLMAEAQHLESIYRQKLNALHELKKSILHKAFNGNL